MKILVIQTAFIGDAVLTLPLIQKIKDLYLNSTIDVVATPENKDVFEASPYINSIFLLDKKNIHKSIFAVFKFSNKIKAQKYDKVIVPHRSFRTSLIVWLSSIKDSTGFNTASISFIYKNIIEYKKTDHEVKRNLALLDNKEICDNWKIFPEVNYKKVDIKKIDQILSVSEKYSKRICIAPGSVWFTKKYPEDYYRQIIEKLVRNNYFIYLTGSPKEFSLNEKIIENVKSGNVLNLAGKLSIIDTIYLIGKSDLLVCNDSAPTHFGMCTQTPVLTLYCSTIPGFGFYPYNNNSHIVSLENISCKPCGIHGYNKCPNKHFNCALQIKPEMVLNKIGEIFSE